jgi:hypothetical protein
LCESSLVGVGALWAYVLGRRRCLWAAVPCRRGVPEGSRRGIELPVGVGCPAGVGAIVDIKKRTTRRADGDQDDNTA